ncbi:hypothetical protein ONE63_010882 [Megalurothrips usitatus]|uniref:Uncharacterized protein n=1 Tax=Megalurothrips usitatus TaxID=439358 RepID=A0AAV7XEF1_9NEOP|nr:hypothetical protein ONE63_010882 [Megalurothrips usitatus]
MCWRLRRSRARRATITPPFAHHHHHAGEVERGKGKEDYNLASDEDCRADEAVTAAAAAAAMQTTDMPTWTFCEKGSSAGPQCPQQQQQQQSLERRRHQKQGQEEEQGKETEEEVQCSKM